VSRELLRTLLTGAVRGSVYPACVHTAVSRLLPIVDTAVAGELTDAAGLLDRLADDGDWGAGSERAEGLRQGAAQLRALAQGRLAA